MLIHYKKRQKTFYLDIYQKTHSYVPIDSHTIIVFLQFTLSQAITLNHYSTQAIILAYYFHIETYHIDKNLIAILNHGEKN